MARSSRDDTQLAAEIMGLPIDPGMEPDDFERSVRDLRIGLDLQADRLDRKSGSPARRAELLVLRELNIKVGDIVMDRDHPHDPAVVHVLDTRSVELQSVETPSTRWSYIRPGIDPERFKRLHRPPPGFKSALILVAVYRQELPSLSVAGRVREIAGKLLPAARYVGTHGEFWEESAVHTLMRLREEARHQPEKVVARPSSLCFCVGCGTKINRLRVPSFSGFKCSTCGLRGPLPKKGRHCVECGSSFDGRGGLSTLCSNCE